MCAALGKHKKKQSRNEIHHTRQVSAIVRVRSAQVVSHARRGDKTLALRAGVLLLHVRFRVQPCLRHPHLRTRRRAWSASLRMRSSFSPEATNSSSDTPTAFRAALMRVAGEMGEGVALLLPVPLLLLLLLLLLLPPPPLLILRPMVPASLVPLLSLVPLFPLSSWSFLAVSSAASETGLLSGLSSIVVTVPPAVVASPPPPPPPPPPPLPPRPPQSSSTLAAKAQLLLVFCLSSHPAAPGRFAGSSGCARWVFTAVGVVASSRRSCHEHCLRRRRKRLARSCQQGMRTITGDGSLLETLPRRV